jgi:hypothetical protein
MFTWANPFWGRGGSRKQAFGFQVSGFRFQISRRGAIHRARIFVSEFASPHSDEKHDLFSIRRSENGYT